MIDWEQLMELLESFGAEEFEELVESFWAELDEAITALAELNLQDAGAIAAQMHFIKGAAANMGLSDVVNCVSAQEQAANAGHLDQIDIAKAAQVYAQSKATLCEEGYAKLGIRF